MKIVNRDEKIKFLHDIANEEEIHSLLEEILPSIGFKDVQITHEKGNAPENGKDVVCSLYDQIEEKKDWYAFVVKKGKITGTSWQICDIESQIKDCFKYEYKSLRTIGERVKINKVKVVTNMSFSNGAQQKILQNSDIDKANVDFWDDEKLISLIDKKCPRFWQSGSSQYKEYVDVFINTIDKDNFSKKLGLSDAKIKKLVNLFIEPILLEKGIDESGQVVYKQKKIDAVLQSDSSVFIIGESGCGKSTLFRQLSKQVIEQNSLRNDYELYPIIISFNQIKQNNFSIEQTIKQYFLGEQYQKINIDTDLILKNGNCVIFIDALDEIASNKDKEKAFDSLERFSALYPSIKLICTSRPSDFLYQCCSDKGFRSFEIDRINRRQIAQYIHAYFGENEVLSKRLIKSLRDSGLLDKLPATPMTLALVTIIFDEQQIEIPSTITDLYGLFVDLLLKKFEFRSTKDIVEKNIKHRILANLAKEMHLRKLTSVQVDDAKKFICSYLQERGIYDVSVEDLLEDIISNSGLLIYSERQELQFKHLSFQEYFTAYEYFHHRPEERTKFVDNFHKLWWQNVAIFYAGFTKDSPSLLTEILDKAKNNHEILPKFNIMTGLGRLMQSLYSTPQKDRIGGLEVTTQLSKDIVVELINTSDEKFSIFKKYSRYAIYQMLLASFEMSHHSITLQEPFRELFRKSIDAINFGESSFENIYPIFLQVAAMGNSSFMNYAPYQQLLEKTNADDLSLIALEEMWFRINYKEISKETRTDEIMWVKKKLEKQMAQLGHISHIVNKPLNIQ